MNLPHIKLSRARKHTRTQHLRSELTFLHGHILLEVEEARCLPDMEMWISKLINKRDVTDAFVEVRLGKAKLLKTSIIDNDLNPVWNESYRIEVCHFAEHLKFTVADKDHAYSEYIGTVDIPTVSLSSGEIIQGWFPICKGNGLPNGKAELKVRVQFISRNAMEKTYDVNCYFATKHNCFLTLYQDAHALDIHQMPQFHSLAQQMPHLPLEQIVPRSCWKDLYETLMEAKHIICITGWAVWHALHLFRGVDLGIDQRTLGELLVEKAQQGVHVYVMIWSEITSGDYVGERGMMNTHDMETFNYFKNTKVKCALTPREMSVNELSDIVNLGFSSGCYTHHQKSVVCDAAGNGYFRRLVGYK